jgi:hypothetical protein
LGPGRAFVGGCLRASLLLWWWVLFCALFLLFGLLIRALFCGLFTGVFGGRPPTPPTRLNRGGSGLRKEEGENGRKGRRGKGFRRFGRVLICFAQEGVHGAGHWPEPATAARASAAREGSDQGTGILKAGTGHAQPEPTGPVQDGSRSSRKAAAAIREDQCERGAGSPTADPVGAWYRTVSQRISES